MSRYRIVEIGYDVPINCDHLFTIPLNAQAETGEWTDTVVGHACEKCYWQLFDGESLTWSAASNRTTCAEIVWGAV